MKPEKSKWMFVDNWLAEDQLAYEDDLASRLSAGGRLWVTCAAMTQAPRTKANDLKQKLLSGGNMWTSKLDSTLLVVVISLKYNVVKGMLNQLCLV